MAQVVDASSRQIGFKAGAQISPPDARDYLAEKIFPTDCGELPEVLDLRSTLRTVRNQGLQSTCVAHVAACMKEWQENKDVGLCSYFSTDFIYNQRTNTNTEGMYARDMLKLLANIGICTDESFQAMKNSVTEEVLPTPLYKEAYMYKIDGYARVSDCDTLKKALNCNGPCYMALPLYNDGRTFWKSIKGEEQRDIHAVAIVGYDSTGFIIRNSWGIDWGVKGYCILPYEDFKYSYECWTTIDANSRTIGAYDNAKNPIVQQTEPEKCCSTLKCPKFVCLPCFPCCKRTSASLEDKDITKDIQSGKKTLDGKPTGTTLDGLDEIVLNTEGDAPILDDMNRQNVVRYNDNCTKCCSVLSCGLCCSRTPYSDGVVEEGVVKEGAISSTYGGIYRVSAAPSNGICCIPLGCQSCDWSCTGKLFNCLTCGVAKKLCGCGFSTTSGVKAGASATPQ